MDPTTVQDFSGGQIDEYDSAGPRYAQRLKNFLIDDNKKLYERNGTRLWGSKGQIPTAERVSGIKIVPDLNAGVVSQQVNGAIIYSHAKAWWVAGPVTADLGPINNYTEIHPHDGTTNSIARDVPIDTKIRMQQKLQHVYASFYNHYGYGGGTYHPKVRKFRANNLGSQYCDNIGLPIGSYTPLFAGTGGGTHSYLYYFTYYYTYTIQGVTYAVEGAPIGPFALTVLSNPISGANPVDISALDFPSNADGDCYPLTGMLIRVYRTKDSETTPRLVGTTAGSTFHDGTTDANLGAPAYWADGTAYYQEAPPCRTFHIVGDFAYYGGFWTAGNPPTPGIYAPSPSSIIQSVPGVYGAAPADFEIATPDIPIGIHSIDYFPIAFFAGSVWRIEGQIDSFGNGSPVLRAITEKAGLIHPNAIVKTDKGLIWAATDGAYYTDGFSAKKLTDHWNKGWGQLWGKMSQSDMDRVDSIYHSPTKHFFFSGRKNGSTYASSTAPNMIVAGNMQQQTEDGGAAIAEIDGLANETNLGNSFLPTALEVIDDMLIIGEWNGYLMKMNIHPHDSSDVTNDDVSIDPTKAAANFKTTAVLPDYISASLDLGNAVYMKWATRVKVLFKLPFAMTKIAAQIYSYNENSFRDDSTSHGKALAEVKELAVPTYRRVYAVLRRFAKGQLRCIWKQIRITKSFTVLYASVPGGVRAYPAVTTDGALNTGQIIGGTWPTDIVGQWLTLDLDLYSAKWQIIAVSGDTVTVADPLNLFPTNVCEWEVKGYMKDCKLGIHNFTVLSTMIEGKEDVYETTDAGTN